CLACSSREINVDLKAAFENIITFIHYIHSQSQSDAFSSFKYIFVVFKCALGNKENFTGLVRETNRKLNCNCRIFRSKRLACKSVFRVVLNVIEYIVCSYIMTHNHPCTKSFMRCDPWFRRLSKEEKENINPVFQQSTLCDAVMEHVRNTYQKELISDDIRNM
ncbi:hypothetical protein EWB00_011061, partial [Schistosoma japonicum]